MLPETLHEVQPAAALEQRDPAAILDGSLKGGEITLVIARDKILETSRFLKQECGFQRLSSVTAVDWHPAEPRFEVVYHLHSIDRNERLRLKCRLPGDAPEIDSVAGVWRAANWYEREVFDLFGTGFRAHPDLKRIMMPADWEGHPLRKDYPVHGFKYGYAEEGS